ncbi:DUF362 domain-containing protein [bacterium]|nr:DUF362 domain-containing protein [bacterium]
MSRDDRRSFLKKTLCSIAAFGGASSGFSACRAGDSGPARSRLSQAKARVVCVHARGVVGEGGALDRSRLELMLDRGIATLTGLEAEAGWRFLFKPDDRVGLKVNTLAGKGISTHPLLAMTLARKISESAGVKSGQIIIWDRDNAELTRAGFSLQTSTSGIRCFGTNQSGVGYQGELCINGQVCGMLSRIVTDQTTLTVNVPVLKDHNLSGLSGALKNMFGAIHNPNKYHDNNCDPFVAQLNALPRIKQNQGLIVADALKVQYEGGPGYQAHYLLALETIIIGLDPVALDLVQLKILDEIRLSKGLKPLSETDHPARHVLTAGQSPYDLGNADHDLIQEIRLEV